MPQELFEKAVKRILPSAIPANLEKIDEYAVGKVLIYSKAPRKLLPMRKHELDFTGYSLQSLLAEEEKLTIVTARSYLFDTGKSTISKTVKLDVSGDFDLEGALAKLASSDFKFKAGETKTVKVTTDFGKVTHISTDLVNSVVSGQIQVKPDHPIVKKAIENGGVMFVVSTLYEAEHCSVGVSISEDTGESGEADVGVMKDKVGGSEDADDEHKSSQVIKRDQPTPLAYLLLKVSVNSQGVVTTQLNTRLTDSMKGGKHKRIKISSRKSLPKISPASTPSSDVYDEWIVIDVDTVEPSEGESQPPPAPKGDAGQDQPVAEAGSRQESSEISYPYPTPLSEIATAKVVSNLGAAKPAASQPVDVKSRDKGAGQDQPDSMPDDHFLYSLKDFQPFQSTTYLGIYEESKNWVRPLLANQKLLEAFQTFTKPPKTYERLNDLSSYFLELGNSLRSGDPAPTKKPKDVDLLLNELSEDVEKRMSECSAIIVVAEAADEFPQHILRKLAELSPEKKQLLKKTILSTPYAHSRHAFADVGPFKDPDLKPIMARMGFSIPLGTTTLLHSHKEEADEEDKLSAALILLATFEKD